jgi:hypothetical protein
MNVHLLSAFVLCSMLIASRDAAAQNAIPESFYPAGEIQAILSQPGCRGIRVYPVFDAQRETNSTMLIGIDADGKEIQSDTSATARYRLYTGVAEDMPTSRTLSRDEARAACSAFSSGNAPFVADLNAGALAGFLGEESLGVMLSHSSANGHNFQARGFRRENGLQGFGVANPGDPCPTNCGSRDQYLCSPN